jgi:hypothetical protein
MGIWEHTFGRMQYYILDPDKRPIPVIFEDYLAFREKNPDSKKAFQQYRRVAGDTLEDGTFISTVFLEIDHRFWGASDPILFETMVFSPNIAIDQELQWRYTSWEDALQGHQRVVTWAQDYLDALTLGLPLPEMPTQDEEEEPDWTGLDSLSASSLATPLALPFTTAPGDDDPPANKPRDLLAFTPDEPDGD